MKVLWISLLALFAYLSIHLWFWEDPLSLVRFRKGFNENLSFLIWGCDFQKCLQVGGGSSISNITNHYLWRHHKACESWRNPLPNKLKMEHWNSDALANLYGDLENFCPILLFWKSDFSNFMWGNQTLIKCWKWKMASLLLDL